MDVRHDVGRPLIAAEEFVQRHDFRRLDIFRGHEFRPFVVIVVRFFGEEERLVGGRAGIDAFFIFRRINGRITPLHDVTVWCADGRKGVFQIFLRVASRFSNEFRERFCDDGEFRLTVQLGVLRQRGGGDGADGFVVNQFFQLVEGDHIVDSRDLVQNQAALHIAFANRKQFHEIIDFFSSCRFRIAAVGLDDAFQQASAVERVVDGLHVFQNGRRLFGSWPRIKCFHSKLLTYFIGIVFRNRRNRFEAFFRVDVRNQRQHRFQIVLLNVAHDLHEFVRPFGRIFTAFHGSLDGIRHPPKILIAFLQITDHATCVVIGRQIFQRIDREFRDIVPLHADFIEDLDVVGTAAAVFQHVDAQRFVFRIGFHRHRREGISAWPIHMAHQAASRVADQFALRILALDDDGLQVGDVAQNAQSLQCVRTDDFIIGFNSLSDESDELRVFRFRQIRDDQRL